MQKYVLTVTLNPAIDETVKVLHFQTGRTFLPEDISRSAGGKGINVSRVLKHLKVPTLACGLSAGPAGAFIRQSLQQEGIPHVFTETGGNTRTSLTVLDPKSAKTTRILQSGPAVTSADTARFKKLFALQLRRAGFVMLAGRSAYKARDSFYGDLIRLARKKGVPVFLDTHSRPFLEALKAKPDFIAPNRAEAEAALGRTLKGRKAMVRAIGFFFTLGIKNVIISLGSDGAVGSDGSGMWLARPPKVAVKNTVGCGDAFNGGFIYHRLRGKPFADCLRMGVAAGTANALSVIPGKINRTQLKRIYQKVKLKKL